ncbi:hypothetical protein T492DRAFT_1122065 [Pavlovales sp. CCMP2436]|nr:hypothetical protein T492DRAFT_1122065 [Pavlovales sp. CCMP2436]
MVGSITPRRLGLSALLVCTSVSFGYDGVRLVQPASRVAASSASTAPHVACTPVSRVRRSAVHMSDGYDPRGTRALQAPVVSRHVPTPLPAPLILYASTAGSTRAAATRQRSRTPRTRLPSTPRPLATTQMDEEQKERGYKALLDMMLMSEQFNITQGDMVTASYEKIDYTFMMKLGTEIISADAERKARAPAALPLRARGQYAHKLFRAGLVVCSRNSHTPKLKPQPFPPPPPLPPPKRRAQAALEIVQGLVNAEMGVRMGRAAEALKKLLGAGPGGMFRLVRCAGCTPHPSLI